jgi:NAD+ kinase
VKKIGICYHPKLEAGQALAEELRSRLEREVKAVWVSSAWDEELMKAQMPGTDLLMCVGGDGTMLRAARCVVPHRTLLLGLNMGRVGFLTEMDQSAVMVRLPEVLSRQGRVEERAMLQAAVLSAANGHVVWGEEESCHDALNDVVVSRGGAARLLQLSIVADGIKVADYRADGVIVATATGSTAYSLALGGPILYPECREIVVTPVAPHLAERHSVVLPSTALVEVALVTDQRAVVSVDGEPGPELTLSQVLHVRLGPHVARFLRLGPPSDFYARVARRLNWVRQPGEESLPARQSGGPGAEAAGERGEGS